MPQHVGRTRGYYQTSSAGVATTKALTAAHDPGAAAPNSSETQDRQVTTSRTLPGTRRAADTLCCGQHNAAITSMPPQRLFRKTDKSGRHRIKPTSHGFEAAPRRRARPRPCS